MVRFLRRVSRRGAGRVLLGALALHSLLLPGGSSAAAETVMAGGSSPSMVYTVQAASYDHLAAAKRAYQRLLAELPEEVRGHLRVETVGGVHALRVGSFATRGAAAETLDATRHLNRGAYVMQAYILPERIQMSVERSDAGAKVPTAGQPGIPAPVAPLARPENEAEAGVPGPVAEPVVVVQEEEKEPAAEAAAEEPAEVAPESPDSAGPQVVSARQREMQLLDFIPAQRPTAVNSVAVLEVDEVGKNLYFPSAVFFDPAAGELFVSSGGDTSGLVVYGADFFPKMSLGEGRGVGRGKGGLVDPASRRLYVCQSGQGELQPGLAILDGAFLVEKHISFTGIEGAEGFSPHRIALANNRLYLASYGFPAVMVLDLQGNFQHWLFHEDKERFTGQVVGKQAEKNPFPFFPAMATPLVDVATDRYGRIYLLSEETSKTYVYSSEEEFLYSFGEKGGVAGKLSRPRGIAIDNTRNWAFVVDYMRHGFSVYGLSGEFIFEHGGKGVDPLWFNYPTDIEVLRDGQIAVSDFFNMRVQIIEMR